MTRRNCIRVATLATCTPLPSTRRQACSIVRPCMSSAWCRGDRRLERVQQPCNKRSSDICYVAAVRMQTWLTFCALPLQLNVYERRALRWGPLLQLPLADAFFAAHALGCLTAVAPGGEELSLEVSICREWSRSAGRGRM